MRKKSFTPAVLNILIMCPLIGMGIDLITPSLPFIGKNLHISSTCSKNLITVYLISYALGNLLIGFLSDAWGRRKLVLSGLFIFTLVSFLPIIFPMYGILFLSRLLQGFAMGAYAALARAVFYDILPQEKLKSTLTWLATMWGIGPVIGPIIGSYLQYYLGWKACFYFFASYSALGFSMMFFYLPETLAKTKPLNIRLIQQNFKVITTNAAFMGIILLMGAAYSVAIVFHTLGPFLIQIQLEKSVVYFGHMALLSGFSFLAGTCFCRYGIKKWIPSQILKIVSGIGLSIALFFLLASYIYHANTLLIFIPTASLLFLAGILYPTGMGMGISFFRDLAGSTSAIMGFFTVLITGFMAFVMSFINKDVTVLCLAYSFLMLTAVICYWFLIQQSKGESYEENNAIK